MTLGPVQFDNSLSTFTNNATVSGTLNVSVSSILRYVNILNAMAFTPGALTEVALGDVGTYNILAMNSSTGRVAKIEASSSIGGVLPGTVVPYYGHVSNGAVKLSHPAAYAAGAGVLYPWNIDSGTPDLTWKVCNGSSADIPDLRGRFVVGYGTAHTLTHVMSATGGLDSVTLDVSHLPDHRHKYKDSVRTNTGSPATYATGTRGFQYIQNTQLTGDGDVNNTNIDNDIGGIYYPTTAANIGLALQATTASASGIPVPIISPYYVLYYIIKLPA